MSAQVTKGVLPPTLENQGVGYEQVATPAPYEAYGLTAEQWQAMVRRYVRARLDLKAEIAKRDAALAAQAAKEEGAA